MNATERGLPVQFDIPLIFPMPQIIKHGFNAKNQPTKEHIMALGINTPSSTFLDFIKYDAPVGNVFRADNIQTPNGWDKDSIPQHTVLKTPIEL